MVGFRLEPELISLLNEHAEQKNQSIHECAKQIVATYFSRQEEISEIRTELEIVEDKVRNLGIDLAIGIRQVLLTGAEAEVVDPWLRRELSCSNWKRRK